MKSSVLSSIPLANFELTLLPASGRFLVFRLVAAIPGSAYRSDTNAYVRLFKSENIDDLFAVSKYGLERS